MDDAHGHHGTRRGPVPDGGQRDSSWSAGEAPPPPPTDADLPEALGEPGGYLYRIRLEVPGPAAKQNVLDELRRELDVFGTSVGRDVGPEDPATFDVLAASDYEPGTVADALVEPDLVEAVTICPTGAGGDRGGGVDRADADGDLAGSIPAVDDAVAAAGVPENGTGASAGAADERSPAVEEAVEEARETFQQLRAENERAAYEEVLEELEGVTFDREFDAAPVDLDPLLEDAGGADVDGAGSDPPGDQPDPASSRTGDGASTDGDASRASTSAGNAALAPEAVVDALATAVEEDALDEADREAIARGLALDAPETLAARVDSLGGTLDDVTTGLMQLKARVDQVDERLDGVEGQVAELPGGGPSPEELSRVDERVTDVTGELADVRETVDELETELSGLRESVGDLARWPDQLGEALLAIDHPSADGDLTRGERSDDPTGGTSTDVASAPPGDAGIETDGGSGFEVTFPDEDDGAT